MRIVTLDILFECDIVCVCVCVCVCVLRYLNSSMAAYIDTNK